MRHVAIPAGRQIPRSAQESAVRGALPRQIDLGGDTTPVNCIICDISATGAKLTVGAHEVPDEFMLVFKRRCRVIRRTDGQVGVKFVQT